MTACGDCGAALTSSPPGSGRDVAPQMTLEPASRGLKVRAGLTLIVVVAVIGLSFVPLPGIPGEFAGSSGVGWLAIGLAPWLAGFGLVELVAACVPGLRRRRIEGEGPRRSLTIASMVVGLALLAVQILGVVALLRNAVWDQDAPLVAWVLILAGASLATLILARSASRWTLGNGFVLCLVPAFVLGLAELGQHIAYQADGPMLTGPAILTTAVLALVPAVLTVALAKLKWLPAPVAARISARLPWPVSGIAPQALCFAVVGVVMVIANWTTIFDCDGSVVLWLAEQGMPDGAGYYVIVGLSTIVLGWCFAQPSRVRTVWRRLEVDPSHTEQVSREVGVAIFVALLTVVPIALTEWIGLSVAHVVLTPVAVVALTSVALDIHAEWSLRRAEQNLVAIWSLHRMYAVVPAVDLLTSRGIPALARSRHFRALFPFFAPYVPVVLMVPTGHAEAAATLLRTRLGDSSVLPEAAVTAFD